MSTVDLGTPFTRWTHRETGERLVAIVAKTLGDGSTVVLPIHAGEVPHPLRWCLWGCSWRSGSVGMWQRE